MLLSHPNMKLEVLCFHIFDCIHLYEIKNAKYQVNFQVFTPARGNRPGVRNVIVLVTDGVGNMEPSTTYIEAREAKARDLHIFTVGVGKSFKGIKHAKSQIVYNIYREPDVKTL